MKKFSEATKQQVQAYLELYPKREAALLPILQIAQKEFGFLDEEAELAVAELMDLSPVTVRETSMFYFMFHRHPIGKYHFQVCHNISCTLMGAETILDHLKNRLGIEDGQRTEDGLFSVERVECIACCDRGPAMLVNDQLHTDLTPQKLDDLIKKYDPKRKFEEPGKTEESRSDSR